MTVQVAIFSWSIAVASVKLIHSLLEMGLFGKTKPKDPKEEVSICASDSDNTTD